MGEDRALYIVVCAAGPASEVGALVGLAQEQGWTVQVIAPRRGGLHRYGRPVRSAHRTAGASRSPKADTLVIAPIMFNTINKLTNGIADNYVPDVVNELVGLGIPTGILPVRRLRLRQPRPVPAKREGSTHGRRPRPYRPRSFDPPKPGSGGRRFDGYPWHRILEEVERKESRPRRIDYLNDPDVPKASSVVPSTNVAVFNEAGHLLLIRCSCNVNWAVPVGAMNVHVAAYAINSTAR